MAIVALQPKPWLLGAGVLLDLLLGDPRYAAHPVRLIGGTLARIEGVLRRVGMAGYVGGVALFVVLSLLWVGLPSAVVAFLPKTAGAGVAIFLIYSLVALRDLLGHAWKVEIAAGHGDLQAARAAVATLVGRETSTMDLAACRRAAIESIGENLTDGFVAPVFWYAIAGLPGILLFKVVSTMDSMVGYKTPRYLRFGWLGARADDAMNWLPARLSWLLLSGVAGVLPGYSGQKGLRIGWRQHGIVPGPNSGWSEATTAGAIQRKLVGPIWAHGTLVTDVWLGEASDLPAGTGADLRRAAILAAAAGLAFAALSISVLAVVP
ncbi:MAG: adenosylcobinamide-phosphate synthase CbiB [Terriglobales bacterium]